MRARVRMACAGLRDTWVRAWMCTLVRVCVRARLKVVSIHVSMYVIVWYIFVVSRASGDLWKIKPYRSSRERLVSESP